MFKQCFFSAIHALSQILVLVTYPKVTVVCFDYDQLEWVYFWIVRKIGSRILRTIYYALIVLYSFVYLSILHYLLVSDPVQVKSL